MAKVVGIDLGTTNTVVAVVRGAKPETLDSLEGRPQTRSVVSMRRYMQNGVEHKETLVGDTALDNYPVAPRDTIISIKRLMGRGFQEAEVQHTRENALYEILPPSKGTDRSVSVCLDGKELTPPQISALILAKVKEDAEFRLGDEISHAVITVPAYFTEVQKAATREAARLAGLAVLKILEEPTSAAIAYGDLGRTGHLDEGITEGSTVLVYDFGGGTFDVSIIEMSGYIASTLGLDGDMWLGGDNLDQILVDFALAKIRQEYPDLDANLDPSLDPTLDPARNLRFMAELRKAAQKTKETLSSARTARIVVNGLLRDRDDDPLDIDIPIRREEFERLILPLIGRYKLCACGQVNHSAEAECARCLLPLESVPERIGKALEIVRRALDSAGVTHSEIDHVLMAGNASVVPLIQQSMEEEFGRDRLRRHKHPKYCVAEGAALLAARMNPQIECDCGHANPPTATECEECGRFIGDLTLKCAYCGARNSKGIVVCRKCGEPLDPMAPGGGAGGGTTLVLISAHNYGIQLQGDLFEVFIEKNDSYPTTDIKTVTRHTQEAGQRILSMPVYAGLNLTRASANELQGEVFSVLPPHLPQDTAVQVKLWLDKDGIFGLSAQLENGTLLNPVILRGRGDARAVELLLEADQSLNARKHQISSMDLQGLEAYREQALALINAQDFDGALVAAERFLHEVQKFGETPEHRALYFVRLARHIGEVYAWALDSTVLFTLGSLTDRVEETLRIYQIVPTHEEEVVLTEAVNRLARATNNLPETVRRFAHLRWTIHNDILPSNPAEGHRMNAELREIMALVQQGNTLGETKLARLMEEVTAKTPLQAGARCPACGAPISRTDPRYCVNGHDRLLMK